MFNRIRKALGLNPRISQAHAHEALRLLRGLEDEFAVASRHGPDRSRRRACLIDETQALLYLAGVGTIGCEYLGLNNDGTPIKRRSIEPDHPWPRLSRPIPPMPPVPPLTPTQAVHTPRPLHQPPPTSRPAQQTRSSATQDRPSGDGDILWLWQSSTSCDSHSPEPARFATGGGGDFTGGGASASFDSSDSGSSSSDSGSCSGGGD